jgi:hypothetical protein
LQADGEEGVGWDVVVVRVRGVVDGRVMGVVRGGEGGVGMRFVEAVGVMEVVVVR